jgi:nitroreductase
VTASEFSAADSTPSNAGKKASQGSLEALATCAVLAPSGDNTQPWTITICPREGTITIRADQSRDQSPMNAGGRMARIAVGAAAENVLVAAMANRLPARIVSMSGDTIEIGVESSPGAESQFLIPDSMRDRRTNRRVYGGSALPGEALGQLRDAVQSGSQTSVVWIIDREHLRRIGALVAKADTALFGDPAMRNAFFENVRFDQPPGAAVDEGLSLGSLELGAGDRIAFRLLRRLPVWLLQAVKIGGAFAKKTPAMVESAAGLCLVLARDQRPETDLEVGRVMERAWLKLTELGCAAQPMMSFPVLENALLAATSSGTDSVPAELEIPGLQTAFRSGLQIPDGMRLGFLLRFGNSEPPRFRTGRRDTAECLHVV